MQSVFISYRRSDSEAYTGRLYDRLVAQFGKDEIFKDVDAIPLGADFRSYLAEVIGRCRVVLVVMGARWIDVCDPASVRRIESPDDFVRIELEAALARDIPVIPVLVSGAAMPTAAQLPESVAAFAYRQAAPVRPDPDFHHDVDRLIASLQPLLPGVAPVGASSGGETARHAVPTVSSFGTTPGAAAPRRTNLPRNLPSLIGRAEVAARVSADLYGYALVTLVGFGGVGKTRLAQHVGVEVGERFTDGVWFVDLAALTAGDEVLPSVARTLGIREYSSESVAVTLVAALRERELLLILDNCERLTESVAALAEELTAAAPQVRILCTSRMPLGVYGERVIRVRGLDRISAVALFEARAVRSWRDGSAEHRAVAELCRRLDDLPLAIELAAARVRSLTPAEILARVSERLGALRATDRRSARHQTLDALVDWSYELLSANEQRLLNRLSVFVGSFDLASAERVCGGGTVIADEVVDLLDRLVDKSLVSADTIPGTARYRIMDTVCEYARRRLEAAGELDEVVDRHIRYFTQQGQSLGERMRGSDARGTSAALLSDIDNLNAALERLGRKGLHTEKARLVVALDLFWQIGAPRAGRLRYEELITVLEQIEPDVRLITLLEAAGFVANQGFGTEAVALLERARTNAREEAIELPPYFYYVAATVAEMDGRPEEALAACAAGTAALQPGDEFMALSLRSRALTSIAKVHPAEALEHAQGTLQQAEEQGLDLFVAVGHMLIGTVHMLQGRLEASEAGFSRAIELAGAAMPQVVIASLVGSAAGHRTIAPERSIARAREALVIEAQENIMPWFRVIVGDLLAWHWAAGKRVEEAALALATMDELRHRLGFAGIWWAKGIRAEAWQRVRAALPAARVEEISARGKSLTVAETRALLGCPEAVGGQ